MAADVAGFLDDMAAGSRTRVAQAMAREPLAALRRRCVDRPQPPALRHAGGFDVIAELKLRSPSQGALSSADSDIGRRVSVYAAAGAVAVSVLTEPERFEGSLEHLQEAALALAGTGVPAMRKDFLVDPYQLYEARAAGAGGALLIVRMLAPPQLGEMLDCARELGLFVLLEAFDEADLELAVGLVARHAASGTRGPGGRAPPERATLSGASGAGARPDPARARVANGPDQSRVRDPAGRPLAARFDATLRGALATSDATSGGAGSQAASLLVGVNSRDLQTLAVVPDRLVELAPHLPKACPRVAESGLSTPADAVRVAQAGYDMALVGSALMRAPDSGALLAAMLAAGRAALR